VPGVVDSHVFQVPNAPALTVDLDRALATETGVTQQEAANNVLVATNSSAQTAPNFWVDPRNSVSYPLVVQVPTYRIGSSQDLADHAGDLGRGGGLGATAAELASFGREAVPMVTSQLNIRPVFDVHADVQGRDLYSAAHDIDKVLAAHRPDASKAIDGHLERPGADHARELHGPIHRHRAGHRPGLSVSGHEFPELDRSLDRADGGAVRLGRGAVDAVPVADADERARAHGHADVHRT
jgi:hypothetical protein